MGKFWAMMQRTVVGSIARGLSEPRLTERTAVKGELPQQASSKMNDVSQHRNALNLHRRTCHYPPHV